MRPEYLAGIIFVSDLSYEIRGSFDSIYFLYNVDDEVLSQYILELGMIQNCVVRASDPSLSEKECGDLVLRLMGQWMPGESSYEVVNGIYQGFASVLGVMDQIVTVDK